MPFLLLLGLWLVLELLLLILCFAKLGLWLTLGLMLLSSTVGSQTPGVGRGCRACWCSQASCKH